MDEPKNAKHEIIRHTEARENTTRIWRAQGDPIGSAVSAKWLCVAVKSRAIDRYRKIIQKSEIALDEQLASCGSGIVDQTLDSVLQRELIAAIHALGEPDREIILRRFYYRQKPKDISLALDLPIRQVENRIFRAKLKLRA